MKQTTEGDFDLWMKAPSPSANKCSTCRLPSEVTKLIRRFSEAAKSGQTTKTYLEFHLYLVENHNYRQSVSSLRRHARECLGNSPVG